MNDIVTGLIEPEIITKTGIGNYNYFISHLKIDLIILLINHLYQRIAVLWRVVESFIVR